MTDSKKLLLAALGLLAFLNGAVDQYMSPGAALSPADMVFMIAVTIVLFTWYYLDAKQIGYRRSMPLDIAVIAVGLVALPYYFLRSRGLKKGLLYTLGFILVIVAWSWLANAGAFALNYGLQH